MEGQGAVSECESTSEKQRLVVVARCDNRCEIQVQVRLGTISWTRCFREGVEVHHLLTRSRGGDLLDSVGEDYHLVGACPQHHRAAHHWGGRDAGLLIDGYVIRDSATGLIVYTGPDEYLIAKYGKAS